MVVDVAVIGSGFGGLGAAIRLLTRHFDPRDHCISTSKTSEVD